MLEVTVASRHLWSRARVLASRLEAVAVPRTKRVVKAAMAASRHLWSRARVLASRLEAAIEPAPESPDQRPNGLVAATILAGASAPFILALIVQLSHLRRDFAGWLVFSDRVGALSGESTMTVVIWLGVWALLALALWKRNLPITLVGAAAAVLMGFGLAFTFPPIIERVEAELAFWIMIVLVSPLALATLALSLGRKGLPIALMAAVAIPVTTGFLLTPPPILGWLGLPQ